MKNIHKRLCTQQVNRMFYILKIIVFVVTANQELLSTWPSVRTQIYP